LTLAACYLLTAALASAPEVTVKPLTGDSQSGRLTALSAEKVALDARSGPQNLPTAAIMWVEFPATEPAAEKPTTWIEMLDGSKVQAIGYTTAAGKARIELTTGAVIEAPTRSIRSVRFRQQTTPALAGQWKEIVASGAAGDLVVIHKTSTRSVEQGENEPSNVTEHALDQTEGTIADVGPDTVGFQFEGEKIGIRREKLEGLVYFQPTKRDFSPPLCRLTDSGGSLWSLRTLELSEGRLTGSTVGGIAVSWPPNSVVKIDFSVGNVVLLSELESDSGGGEPGTSLQPAGMSYKFGRIFQVRSGPPLGADVFRIGGARFDAGLSVHSPLTLVYRVPEGFRWFRSVVGVDDSVVAPGRFALVILGDGKELVRQQFSDESRRRAIPIDLDLTGVRRITIVLDPQGGQDIGDQLDLCEARFTK
jgi:NPCBM/NEW2 domain